MHHDLSVCFCYCLFWYNVKLTEKSKEPITNILPHCCISLILFISVHTHIFTDIIIFLNHQRLNWRHPALDPRIFQCIFPKNKDIALHNHGTKVKIRKFNIHTMVLSNPQSMLNFTEVLYSFCPSEVLYSFSFSFFFFRPGCNPRSQLCSV